ncbi:MAG: hypothetical protein ACOCWC_04900 [Bacteroidota bacterium]
MEKTMKDFVDVTRKRVIDNVATLSANKNIDFDSEKANEYIKKTFKNGCKKLIQP